MVVLRGVAVSHERGTPVPHAALGQPSHSFGGACGWRSHLIAANFYDRLSVGSSILSICTRCCFTMTILIQVYSNLHKTRVFIMNTDPDEVPRGTAWTRS